MPLTLSLMARRNGSPSASFSVSFTNLNAEGNVTPGSHASVGFTTDPVGGTITQKWGTTSGGSELGTGANPTASTDNTTIYLEVTRNGETAPVRSVAVRYLAGSAAGGIAAQNWTVEDTVVNLDASTDFTLTNLTGSYSLVNEPSGVVINSSTGVITGTPDALYSGTMTVRFTDQYGRTIDSDVSVTAAYRAQATAADGLGPYSWTVTDDTINEDFTSDFTANGNTLSYVITGLPAGVSDDGDGTISGTPTTPSSGTITITATDEYGRTTTSTPDFTTAYRAQATGGVDLDLSFVEDSAIASTDLKANWTANGNTLTYAITGTALPTGLSVSSAGVMTGTPTDVTADATYTLRGTDEYGRTTDDTFTLEITAAAVGTDYSVGGNDPEVVVDLASATDYFRKGGVDSTFAGVLSFARTDPACYINGSGAWTEAADGVARQGHHVHNGSAWVKAGMLLESDAATQLLHTTNALVTQSHTVSAQAYTLHFTGTGSITLSGAHSATLNGTAAGEENRVSLTFTPSAGSLTLTVSGTVTNAQLEAGVRATSYIPNTAGSGTVTRNAETLFIPWANVTFNNTAMSIQMDGKLNNVDENVAAAGHFLRWYGSSTRRLEMQMRSDGSYGTGTPYMRRQMTSSSIIYPSTQLAEGSNTNFSLGYRHESAAFNFAVNGTADTEVSNSALGFSTLEPDIEIGTDFNGVIGKIRIWEDVALTDAQLETATS